MHNHRIFVSNQKLFFYYSYRIFFKLLTYLRQPMTRGPQLIGSRLSARPGPRVRPGSDPEVEYGLPPPQWDNPFDTNEYEYDYEYKFQVYEEVKPKRRRFRPVRPSNGLLPGNVIDQTGPGFSLISQTE